RKSLEHKAFSTHRAVGLITSRYKEGRMATYSVPWIVAVSTLAACSTAPQTPVPLVGSARDLVALAGRWEGAYSSGETGRGGCISFTLTANRDSAFGGLVMIPRGFGRPLPPFDCP